MNKAKIICRFAPSPTGLLHVGGARSALFNYLYARQNGGKLILRIEDTDKERSKKEYEEDIVEGFKWFGLDFDETHRQSERIAIHQKYLKQLLDSGKAYVSKEENIEGANRKAGAELRRAEVIRFKNPNRKVAFDDLIKGHIEFDTTELGDFVIAKSFDEPLFHLAVVVDDFDMGITHVIRGEDHISNTPRQMLIQEAIGAPTPIYAHIPLILAPDRSKLSKRKHGESVSLKFYREQGYLPEALLNFLALLGRNPGDVRELLTKKELIKEFKLEKVQKGGAVFNVEKLNWMNKEYWVKDKVKQIAGELSDSEIGRTLKTEQVTQLSAVVAPRIEYLGQIKKLVEAKELDYISRVPAYDNNQLLWSKKPDKTTARKHIENIIKILSASNELLTEESVKSMIFPYAEKEGRGEVLWPLRFALSGLERSIDPFNLIAILGKAESVARLKNALHLLE